jgi:hypothetical protein
MPPHLCQLLAQVVVKWRTVLKDARKRSSKSQAKYSNAVNTASLMPPHLCQLLAQVVVKWRTVLKGAKKGSAKSQAKDYSSAVKYRLAVKVSTCNNLPPIRPA